MDKFLFFKLRFDFSNFLQIDADKLASLSSRGRILAKVKISFKRV